jgi:hypothetical protein
MELNIAEALCYLGAPNPDAALLSGLTALAEELQSRIVPRFTWALADTSTLALPGQMAAQMLADCPQSAVLACTLGAEFDLWMRQLSARDMACAVMLDALGSVYVEAGCDAAEDAIRARFPGKHLTDRFSPGYGDLPLDVQPRLLAFAGASRIGVSLTPSLLMTPQKSVSAIVGIADTPQPAWVRGCAYCTLNGHCQYRKAGTTCHV